jgi:tetratricopeptide (TPR) repeat protein
MDQLQWNRLESVFADATALPAPQRGAFLARACAGDPALLAELQSLLAAHEVEAGPLDSPPGAGSEHPDAEPLLAPGTRLGPWVLGALIGRGGAGEVYLATRADGAFDQQVALKLLRREAADQIARFTAERQILARLDHPGIARLLDGGLTGDGRPYAVVEYVAGEPMTDYCRARHATLAERLALIDQVCEVVAYAHRSLIVHRDLKSANILVTPGGRVKLLDFGIAKQLDGAPWPASELTIAPFTPDFAAPEQLTGGAITTATDVYALGALLFELLTDRRPWRTDGQPFARIVQSIVNDSADAPSRVAGASQSPPVPAAMIAGDLDAIVAKCLRKEPAHRYGTVDELRQDIDRHRRHAPVSARVNARLYVFGRLLRRHRLALAGVTLVLVAIIGGGATAVWQAAQARRQADQARLQADRADQVKRFALSLFDGASIEGGGNQQTTARQLLIQARKRLDRELADQPAMAVEMLSTLGSAYVGLGEEALALEALREAVARGDKSLGPGHPLTLGARARLANALVLAGEIGQAEPLAQAALAGLGPTPRADAEGLMVAWSALGVAAFEHGRFADGVKALRMQVQVADAYLPVSDRLNRVNARVNLVNGLQGAGDPTANAEAKRTYDLAREVYGDELAPMLLQARFFYADTLPAERTAEGIVELESTLAQMRQALGPRHFMISGVLQSLGEKRPLIGDTRGAVEAMRAYREMEDALQGDKPTYARAFARLRLGGALLQDGRPRQAVAEMRSAPEMLIQALGDTDQHMVDTARVRVALALAESGDFRRADVLLATVKNLETATVQGGTGKDLVYAARVRRLEGRPTDAERMLQLALNQFERAGLLADREEAQLQLAYAQLDTGHAAEALPVLQDTWSRMRARHTMDSPLLAGVAVALGRAQFASNDVRTAEQTLRWAADFWRRYDPSNREGGVASALLARILDARSDPAGAREWRGRAVELLSADPRAGDRALLASTRT